MEIGENNIDTAQDEIRAYRILLKRHINDDRLLVERTIMFLTGSSILFLGFVNLFLIPGGRALAIWLPLFGLALCFLDFCSNIRTKVPLDYWEGREKEMVEKESSLSYMKDKVQPDRAYDALPRFLNREGLKNKMLYTLWLPALFFLLWTGSFIYACLN